MLFGSNVTAGVTARVVPAADRPKPATTTKKAIDLRVLHVTRSAPGEDRTGPAGGKGPSLRLALSPPRLTTGQAAWPTQGCPSRRSSHVAENCGSAAAPPSAAEASTALRPHGASTGSSRTYASTRRCTTAARQGKLVPPHSWKSFLGTATHNWLCGQHLYSALVLRIRLLQLRTRCLIDGSRRRRQGPLRASCAGRRSGVARPARAQSPRGPTGARRSRRGRNVPAVVRD